MCLPEEVYFNIKGSNGLIFQVDTIWNELSSNFTGDTCLLLLSDFKKVLTITRHDQTTHIHRMHSWTRLKPKDLYWQIQREAKRMCHFLALQWKWWGWACLNSTSPPPPHSLLSFSSTMLCSSSTWLTGDPCHPIASCTVIFPLNLLLSSFKGRGGGQEFHSIICNFYSAYPFHWHMLVLFLCNFSRRSDILTRILNKVDMRNAWPFVQHPNPNHFTQQPIEMFKSATVWIKRAVFG